MAVCSEILIKHINTLCGQNVEFVNVKLAVHTVTTGLYRGNMTAGCAEMHPTGYSNTITIRSRSKINTHNT